MKKTCEFVCLQINRNILITLVLDYMQMIENWAEDCYL